MDKNWIVVKFIAEDTVEAVPTNWILENKCYWPSYPDKRSVIEAIKRREAPAPNVWKLFDVSFFRNNVFDNYASAEKKAEKATICSDLESHNTLPIKRKRLVKRYSSFSSTEYVETQPSALSRPPELKKGLIAEESSKDHVSSKKTIKQQGNDSGEEANESGSVSENEEGNSRNLLWLEANQLPTTMVASSCESVFTLPMSSSHTKTAKASLTPKFVERQLIQSNSNVNRPINKRLQVADHHLTEKELLIKVIKKQNIQNGLLSSINDRLQILDDAVSNTNSTIAAARREEVIESIFNKFDLPVTDNNALEEFEEFLKNEDEFNKTVKELSRLGGETVYDLVVRISEKFISNKLASEFSYYGKKQKRTFNKLVMNKLVLQAGLNAFSDRSQIEFEKSIMKWLRRAKERKQ